MLSDKHNKCFYHLQNLTDIDLTFLMHNNIYFQLSVLWNISWQKAFWFHIIKKKDKKYKM